MAQTANANPTSEHALSLRLFVTDAGGWWSGRFPSSFLSAP
jgi:hypothetical protein